MMNAMSHANGRPEIVIEEISQFDQEVLFDREVMERYNRLLEDARFAVLQR